MHQNTYVQAVQGDCVGALILILMWPRGWSRHPSSTRNGYPSRSITI